MTTKDRMTAILDRYGITHDDLAECLAVMAVVLQHEAVHRAGRLFDDLLDSDVADLTDGRVSFMAEQRAFLRRVMRSVHERWSDAPESRMVIERDDATGEPAGVSFERVQAATVMAP